MKITRKALSEAVSCNDLQHLTKTNEWVFRQGFFYTHGYTSEKWMNKVSEALKKANLGSFTVNDHGEVWKPFRGGAGTRAQSHWYVTVAFTSES